MRDRQSNSAQSDFIFTGTIKKMFAYEECKEILFMSDDLTFVIHLNEFRSHTSFLEWAHAFMVPVVNSIIKAF